MAKITGNDFGTVFSVEDVMSAHPDWTEDEALDAISENGRSLEDYLTQIGNEQIADWTKEN